MRTLIASILLLVLAGSLPADDKDLVKVLVARRDLPRGAKLDEPDKLFKWARFTKGEEPQDAVSDLDKLKGRVLLVELAEDQPLRGRFLGKAAELVQVLPPGHRAFSIKVAGDRAVEGFVMPGSRVDVLAAVTKDDKPETRVVAKDVLVLAIDARVGEKAEQLITLALKPDQLEVLALVVPKGKLSVVLRKPGEGK